MLTIFGLLTIALGLRALIRVLEHFDRSTGVVWVDEQAERNIATWQRGRGPGGIQ